MYCCISYHFYIKPQQTFFRESYQYSCISYHFYIKPQLIRVAHKKCVVVYLIISTSNHNNTSPI